MPSNDQILLDNVLATRRDDVAPELNESDFFELFVSEQVLKEYDLNYDEIQSGIVGGSGDGGIDAVFLFLNGELIAEDTAFPRLKSNIVIELFIFQAKTTKGFAIDAIHKLKRTSEELFDLSKDYESLNSIYDPRLLSNFDRFRKLYRQFVGRNPSLTIKYIYASRGTEVHPHVEREVEFLKDAVRALFSAAELEFEFLTAKRLLELARKSAKTTYELVLSESPISTGNVSFVCLVGLEAFNRFISDESGKLNRGIFEANVRDYQGKVQVNRAIQATLQDHDRPEDFWWLNNGVTIVAAKATLSGKTLTLETPQIVNGLQTSAEINKFRYVSSI